MSTSSVINGLSPTWFLPLNDAAGSTTAADASGNGHASTVSLVAFGNADSDTGDTGKGATATSSTGGITISSSSAFNAGTGAMTIGFFVRLSASITGTQVVVGSQAGNTAFWIGISANKATYSLGGSASFAVTESGGPALNDGNDHLVIFRRDGSGNATLSVDGVDYSAAATTFSQPLGSSSNQLGVLNFDGNPATPLSFALVSGEAKYAFGVVGTAITDAQVTSIYNAENASPVTVTVADANLKFSPYNWFVNGSTSARTVNPGSLKLGFSGTSIGVKVDVSALTSFPSTSYPKIKFSIDGGLATYYQLKSSDATVPLANGIASGSHVLQLWGAALDVYDGGNGGTPVATKWSGANALVVDGFVLDAGATTVPVTPQFTKSWLAYGDSITEGEWQLGSSSSPSNAVAYADSTSSHVRFLAEAFGADVSNIGFGGQSWTTTFNSDVPPLPSTWNFIFSGQARSFTTPPDYVSINMGSNGGLTNSAVVTSFLTSLRAAVGVRSQVVVFVPFGGYGRTAITAGVATYKLGNPSDNVFLIDLNDGRFVGTIGTPTLYLSDGLHPNAIGQAIVASELVNAAAGTFLTAGAVDNGRQVYEK